MAEREREGKQGKGAWYLAEESVIVEHRREPERWPATRPRVRSDADGTGSCSAQLFVFMAPHTPLLSSAPCFITPSLPDS